MRRASLVILALGLGSGTAWSQVPCPSASSQIGALPAPSAWGPAPPPSAPQSAPPAAFPVIPPAAPPAQVQAPTVLLVQLPAVAPIAASAPVMLPTPQSPIAYSPYVNPFVVQPTAQAQPQQGIGTVALIGATLIADNPWIIDRILAHWGEHLHKRGMPVLRLAPPGSAVLPTAASAAVVSLGQPGAITVVSGPQHKTRFGRWFWGD